MKGSGQGCQQALDGEPENEDAAGTKLELRENRQPIGGFCEDFQRITAPGECESGPTRDGKLQGLPFELNNKVRGSMLFRLNP